MIALEVLRRIPRKRSISANELREQITALGIERDIRSIQRLLESLSDHFSDIEVDTRSKPYGYKWKDHARGLALAQMTPQESLVLHLAQEHLQNLLPAPLMRSMKDFFEQAKRNLDSHPHSQREREWSKKIRVVASTQPLLAPKIKQQVLEAISEALYHNQYLNLDYSNAKDRRRKAQVMPLGLAQQGQRLYLVCRFEGFDNERSLAVHRIHSAHASSQVFYYPEGFDLKRYDDDGRFGFGEGHLVRLSFQIDYEAGRHLLETPLSKDQQTLLINDTTLLVNATVVDSGMLDAWLRSFGNNVSQINKVPCGA
ncbi:helix-turn-helix transcriptional regulator [Comamonas jiangduensis]|uniref:helix-turn-helix transcriptional regulator n=1 Tax=Comamonas jiangduensis TaxID=1194168 RepID=UPI003BF91965